MNFETVIGLEVHVELNTNSKIFHRHQHILVTTKIQTQTLSTGHSQCSSCYEQGVIDAGIKAALALNMDIHQNMHFDRKNYFYPDNPKAYQISQFDEPIGYNGWIEIELEDGSTKKIRIERAHLKKMLVKTLTVLMVTHILTLTVKVCHIEIVSEADMRSPEEAYAYLTALKEVINTLVFLMLRWKKVLYVWMPAFLFVLRSRRIWYKS